MDSEYALALMEAATDAVIVIDHHGLMESVNTAAVRLFGYSADEMVGRNVSMLMPAGERARHDDYIRRYLETGDARVIGRGREVKAQRSDGNEFPASLAVGRIGGTDPPRFVGYIHDLTNYQRALSALQADRDGARARELEAHRTQTRLLSVSRLATMGEMASGIAHEINQPLAAISNYARACARFAAQQPPALDELQECMNEIAHETQRAADIIRDLRELVRAIPEERAPRDLGDIVRQTRLLILADARSHGTDVVFEIAASLPPVVVDVVQIQQLLLNLVHNALEALESRDHGKRKIRITTGTTADGHIELCVMDNGPGVDPQVQPDMFEPFVTTKPFGTGLGLAISRTIAQNHGGQLLFRSSESGGTCFALRLKPHEEASGR